MLIPVCRVEHPESGRVVEVETDVPGCPFFPANSMPEIIPIVGKEGANYFRHIWGLLFGNSVLAGAVNHMTTSEEIAAMNAQKIKMHEEVGKYSAMTDDFMKHISGLGVHLGISTDMPTLTQVDIKHKTTLDLPVFETLLKKYQRIEGLKNNVLVEKNEVKIVEMKEEIETLETEDIPNFIEENREELQKYMSASVSIGLRNMMKMMKLDMLIEEVTKAQNQYVTLGEEQHVLLKEIDDQLEQAAKIWFDMPKD